MCLIDKNEIIHPGCPYRHMGATPLTFGKPNATANCVLMLACGQPQSKGIEYTSGTGG